MIAVKLILITCTCVMGLKIAFSKGMLLENIGEWLENKVEAGHKAYELFICPWCMATLQSIVAHAFAFGLGILPMEWNWQLLIRWPLVVMASSFICGNAWNLYETINRIRERNEAERDYYDNTQKNDNHGY